MADPLDTSKLPTAYTAGQRAREAVVGIAKLIPSQFGHYGPMGKIVSAVGAPVVQYGRGVLGIPEAQPAPPPDIGAAPSWNPSKYDFTPETAETPAAPAMANMPTLGTPTEEGIPSRGTVSVVPSEYFTGGPSLPLSRELSAAREAAAARGDWKAVNASYGEAAPKIAPPDLAAYPDTLQGRHDRNVALHQYELEQKQANIGAEHGIKTKEQATAEMAAKAAMYGHTLTAQTERAKELRAEREFGQTPKQIGEELVPSDIPGLPPVVLKKFGVLNPQTGQYEQVAGTGTKPSGPTPSANHVAALKANPKLAAQFDQQYGAGAAKRALGG